MCYIWNGKIEKCQNCSESDYASFLRVIRNIEPARPTHHLATRTAQNPLKRGNPQSSRRVDREQDLTHQAQPSSSRHDALINGTAQHKRQKTNADQHSTSIHNARSDWTNGRGRKEIHQDPKSSSRVHVVTDLTGDDEQQGTSGETSQDHPHVEDMDVLTMGMNKLPRPSWEDERIILPLVEQQLKQDEYAEDHRRKSDEIWAMYGKEREVLAACSTPQPEEIWTPSFEEEEILEREIPLEEAIWTRSVLEGEVWMRNILEEIEIWPQQPPAEADIWTREDGGMLSAAVLRRIWRIFTLQASLEDEDEISDENTTAWRMEEGDEVTHTFSEVLTSAAYPPLAFQALD